MGGLQPLVAAIFLLAATFPRGGGEGVLPLSEDSRRELLRLAPVNSVAYLETQLTANALITVQGDATIFGCASMNVTVLKPTLLTNSDDPGFRLDLYVYVEKKFPMTAADKVDPTWVVVARSGQGGDESTEILLNVTGTWKNSTYYMGVRNVQQSYVFSMSFFDAAAFPTSGITPKKHKDGSSTTTLADAIPYMTPFLTGQSSKHYVMVGTKTFPYGAIRGQVQSFYIGEPRICGLVET